MTLLENPYVVGMVCLLTGSLLSYWLLRWKERNLHTAQTLQQQALLQQAQLQAENITREANLKANEISFQIRNEVEQTLTQRRHELTEIESRLNRRETLINEQLENLVEDEKSVRELQHEWERRNQSLLKEQQRLDELTQQRLKELQAIAELSQSDAQTLVMKEAETLALHDATILSRHILEDAKTRAEENARRILSLALQRYAGEHTFENTSATVALPSEDLKGRIIGREGRNIRAFETATGVTVLIDDTPNAVVLSGFDPVRREVAREAMQRLIQDGRIHPTRIEEVVQKVSQEIDETIVRVGQEAVFKSGVAPLHYEVVKLLGRLRFRHSFSQNLLQHAVEVAHLMGLMAAEMGLDVAHAKRAGLLHDIGKAVSHEIEGTHALVGAELLRRYGESEEIASAVASHHDEVPHHGPLGILVSAADAISASRPGARSETMTTYIKRVEDLERLGASFEGVEKCFAVQAGRELRIMVRPDRITDEQAYALARNISRKVENDLQYPGQIRITVVRETRCIEYAK